jgi:hypothetical protein
MHLSARSFALGLVFSALGCAVGSDPDVSRPAAPPSSTLDDAGGLAADSSPSSGALPSSADAVIYASTNTELWRLDPVARTVTKIGAFDFGGATSENMTDVAVNGAGEVWVCSETHVYLASLPSAGTGSVKLTLKLTLPSTSKFYALGFAPAGVLESGEGLVAGDSLGDLYYIPTSSPTPTLQKLGGFGPCRAGDPKECTTGAHWELSGDVVFYSVGGAPRGLATLRACTTCSGGTSTCDNTNDVVAEIDMAALATKSPSAVLRKRLLGGGTGVARTFGIGAWGSEVYAFTYGSKTVSPALVSIDGSGVGVTDQSFGALSSGWTGAGVTTKAAITVIQ